MGKIISPTLVTETVQESDHELTTEKGSFELQCDDTDVRVAGLTLMGYDEEIGLWEEQEHRNRLSDVSIR